LTSDYVFGIAVQISEFYTNLRCYFHFVHMVL